MTKKTIPVFFFSGTGNTWWVAQRLSEELHKKGFQATTYPIEQVSQAEALQQIKHSDIIALGYPVYNSDAPLNMLSFISQLPKQDQTKPMLVFVSQAIWSGDGAYFFRKEVERKGYQIRWAVPFNMPNNISLDLGLVLNAFLSILNAKPEKAHKRIKKLAARVSEDRNWIIGKSPFFSFGWTQRIPSRKAFSFLQSSMFQVDSDKCTACERCVQLCPVDNISMKAGLPHFNKDCILCQRCFNYCPELAINSFGKPFKPNRSREAPYKGPDRTFSPEMITSTSKNYSLYE